MKNRTHNTQNQKQTNEISRTQNDERGIGEFKTHRIDKRKEEQGSDD